MIQFLEYLYTRFILRDFLAKALPGFLVSLAIYFSFFHNLETVSTVWQKVKDSSVALTFFILSSYLLTFAVGMMVQFIGMQCRIARIHPWTEPETPTTKHMTMREQTKLSLQKSWIFQQQNKELPFALTQRERSAVLKEMTGNLATAIILIALITFVKYLIDLLIPQLLPSPPPQLTPRIPIWAIWILLILIGGLLSRQNYYHCYEQLCWEEIGTKVTLGNFSSRM
jgi:hypothetical protein